MNGKIRVGDKIRLTIVGTAYEAASTSRFGSHQQTVNVMYGDREVTGPIDTRSSGVTVEVLAPDSWPPRPGDLWEDGRGLLWFCLATRDGDSHQMISQDGAYASDGVEDLLQQRGPFRLVSRRPDDEPPF